MNFIALSSKAPRHKIKALGYLTGLKIRFDKRQNWYELRGTKTLVRCYKEIINQFVKIHKCKILNEWEGVDKYSINVYDEVF